MRVQSYLILVLVLTLPPMLIGVAVLEGHLSDARVKGEWFTPDTPGLAWAAVLWTLLIPVLTGSVFKLVLRDLTLRFPPGEDARQRWISLTTRVVAGLAVVGILILAVGVWRWIDATGTFRGTLETKWVRRSGETDAIPEGLIPDFLITYFLPFIWWAAALRRVKMLP